MTESNLLSYALGFHPNATAMDYDNSLDQSQPATGPFGIQVELTKLP